MFVPTDTTPTYRLTVVWPVLLHASSAPTYPFTVVLLVYRGTTFTSTIVWPPVRLLSTAAAESALVAYLPVSRVRVTQPVCPAPTAPTCTTVSV